MRLSRQRLSAFLPLFLFVCFLPSVGVALGRHGHKHARNYHHRDTDTNDITLSAVVKTLASQRGDYICSPDSPCSNGACCGESGWCGYGPAYCGDGCQSNCNATAECGEFAATPGAGCPLNVCCSQYGFCGTTADFCGEGCQSNCDQPKPSPQPGNVQKRVIGYWEGWSPQRVCGSMDAGEIPIKLLTHLNIAFGYINQEFKITNMDGLGVDVYRQVGNLKARNPNLKILIALGGWTFSDPGPWQSVFPTLAASAANRAIFIRNLLGFLSEYGYDGVDFDWEYPGADDRGGSEGDGENYTLLMRELREAIQAGGKSYLVTYTAPTSYWYLRHFDLKAMTDAVDWVNLMSYDLHGIWDSENPIGNQVLAHTNLTEIDLALDLFWRVNVDPSQIVLGLGFYGRTFQLTDGACWHPGCPFDGPGAGGRCTETPGILSYREIGELLDNTGATAHLDAEAAVRYLVYADNSWVSYDDATTFAAKIDYANRVGLSGLMIWAIDLDDNSLTALQSIVDTSLIDSTSSPFDLVDLKNLFPEEDLPPEGIVPTYGLTTIGGDLTDPSAGPFGFLLFAGDTHAVTQLRKREGLPDPFVFLDCPDAVLGQPESKIQKARVVCVSEDVAGCFRVMERGVEGTVVEMPDNCAPNTFARAVSLEVSKDQYVPERITKRNPTSQVYDFSFDFALDLMRRDTNNTSIRLDYSNVPGYWGALVDSPGIESNKARDLNTLKERFHAFGATDWRSQFDAANFDFYPHSSLKIKESIDTPLFWQTTEDCPSSVADFDEGFAAYASGRVDAEYYFGFSLVASMNPAGLTVTKQANGFLVVKGSSDIEYGIAGVGTIDISRAARGNPANSRAKTLKLRGQRVDAGGVGNVLRPQAILDPYFEIVYQMATFNETDDSDFSDSATAIDGKLTARVLSDFGGARVDFPIRGGAEDGEQRIHRESNLISIPDSDRLYGSPGAGGKIALGTLLRFGVRLNLPFLTKIPGVIDLPEMAMVYNTVSEFSFWPEAGDESCTDYKIVTNIYQVADNGEILGWREPTTDINLAFDAQSPGRGQVCYPNANEEELERRSSNYDGNLFARQSGSYVKPGWGYRQGNLIDPSTYIGIGGKSQMIQGQQSQIPCASQNCHECEVKNREDDEGRCCGCSNMFEKYEFTDIPNCVDCYIIEDGELPPIILSRERPTKRDVTPWKKPDEVHPLLPRIPGMATLSSKKVSVCNKATQFYLNNPYRYPAFPKNPTWPWAGIEGGRWDSISRYWGNTTEFCAGWAVLDHTQPDSRWVSGNRQRAEYQTEHVFEGQLIGDFFTEWLEKGEIINQRPKPTFALPKLDCLWVSSYILLIDPQVPWTLNGRNVPFINLMLTELGSQSHLDRLTIFLARPNGKKGSMFTGNQPTDLTKYSRMSKDDKLQSVKKLGLIFEYLNTRSVFEKFCATYEAIYDLLGRWDQAYAGTPNLPSLQDEWKEYIRVVLDSLVRRSLVTFETTFWDGGWQAIAANDYPYSGNWLHNRLWNKGKIKMSLTCNNMDPSKV